LKDLDIVENQIIASDGAVIVYYEYGDSTNHTLIISPAFSGSARLYVERFGKYLSNYHVIAVELRGHGKAGGCKCNDIDYCSDTQSPIEGSYFGFRMSRLASDVEEVRISLGLEKFTLLGHSMGGNVLYSYIDQFGTSNLKSLIIYDQSPKNLSDGPAENHDFPIGYSSYPMDEFLSAVKDMALYSKDYGYYMLPKQLKSILGGPNANPVYDIDNPTPSFVLTKEEWQIWSKFANKLNGKSASLLLWDSLISSYTDIFTQINNSNIPVLIYGGEMSIVPWQTMRWVHNQIANSHFMLFSAKEGGVHGVFMNDGKDGQRFMNNINSFLANNQIYTNL
jgi:pimeloyl-ACP methyl ester carboxylesterase